MFLYSCQRRDLAFGISLWMALCLADLRATSVSQGAHVSKGFSASCRNFVSLSRTLVLQARGTCEVRLHPVAALEAGRWCTQAKAQRRSTFSWGGAFMGLRESEATTIERSIPRRSSTAWIPTRVRRSCGYSWGDEAGDLALVAIAAWLEAVLHTALSARRLRDSGREPPLGRRACVHACGPWPCGPPRSSRPLPPSTGLRSASSAGDIRDTYADLNFRSVLICSFAWV